MLYVWQKRRTCNVFLLTGTEMSRLNLIRTECWKSGASEMIHADQIRQHVWYNLFNEWNLNIVYTVTCLSQFCSPSGMWCVWFRLCPGQTHNQQSENISHTHTHVYCCGVMCVCIGMSLCNLFSPALVFTSQVKCECVFVCVRECNYFSTHTFEWV